jgi:sugar transferase (PEP-CTERM/EpsH1 system associated)
MKDVLFLAHRVPFPPDKGDKIRSFHLLRHFAEHSRVHLGAFVDSEDDWKHVEALQRLCASVELLPLDPRWARVRSLRGLLSQDALSFAYYHDARMHAWIETLRSRHPIEAVFVFSSQMAQYVPRDLPVPRVLDFCDVDSAKWEQYAPTATWPMSWVYAREGRLLAAAEERLAREFDASLFVSEPEAQFFRARAPRAASRVHALRNGVDHAYFDPALDHSRPAGAPARYLVFTGAMDYRANVDAVDWFAREVFPRVRAQEPALEFAIVGARPAAAVRQLAQLPGVTVTGSVPDVRPWIAHAAAVVAPLRIARGVQNKVLEGMSMGRQVIATRAALEGIGDGAPPGTVAAPDDAAGFTTTVLNVLRGGDGLALGAAGREFVRAQFDWGRNLGEVMGLLRRAG